MSVWRKWCPTSQTKVKTTSDRLLFVLRWSYSNSKSPRRPAIGLNFCHVFTVRCGLLLCNAPPHCHSVCSYEMNPR